MKMMLMKWLFLLLVTPGIEGSLKLWKPSDFSAEERVTKKILETCYGDNNFKELVFILGNPNEFFDRTSVIRMNDLLNIDEDYESRKFSSIGVTKVIIIEDSPTKLHSDLILFKKTRWWNHMLPFFIIGKDDEKCGNFKEILYTTWRMNILNSIYICSESENTTLYTLNPITNYAPDPWEKMEELNDSNIYHQIFDPVCKRWRSALIGTVWKDVRGLVIIERECGISYHQVQGTWDRFCDMIDFKENQLVIFTDQLGTIEGMVRRIADHLNTVILIIDHTRTLIAPLLAILANHCNKIQRLAATRVGPSAGPQFQRLLTCNTQLRSINCADARHIIEILSEISRDWISLELWYCNGVHDINCATKLQQILQQSPSIEKLRLESLTEEMMLTIVACNQLKSLTLPLCIENTICALANPSMLKRLTDLDLRYFVSDDDLLVHLLSNCINLRSIGLHSLFDTSCINLNYDRTKVLNGYLIKVELPKVPYPTMEVMMDRLNKSPIPRLFQLIIRQLNASLMYVELYPNWAPPKHLEEHPIDVSFAGQASLQVFQEFNKFIVPPEPSIQYVVLVKSQEKTVLNKIRHLWSTQVLWAAAIALIILFSILAMKDDVTSAILDITRFLIYVSIQTDMRSNAFRIYFTTMLIFIVISNGVFQGKIAAFLTKPDKAPPVKTMEKLEDSGYQFYTLHSVHPAMNVGLHPSESIITPVNNDDKCVDYVLGGTLNACIIPLHLYEEKHLLKPLDLVQPRLGSAHSSNWEFRNSWPFYKRFNYMLMQATESGIYAYWEKEEFHQMKEKRKADDHKLALEEIEAPYRPIKLIKLDFVFKLLAIGLALATIVLIVELRMREI